MIGRLVLARLLQAIPTLLVVVAIVFFTARATGDPIANLLPVDASQQQRDAAREAYGLDEPLLTQFGIYLGDLVRGDLGQSVSTGLPVTEVIASRIVNSLLLASGAILLTLVTGIPLGVLAAIKRDTIWDRIALGISVIGQAAPPFLLAILAILLFALELGWLPSAGAGSWSHYILPASVLAWTISAPVVRLTRSSMLDVLGADYVKFARIKGLPERLVVWKHALRNALIPVVTFIGFEYGRIIASAVVIEVVFAWPGLGQLAYQAILSHDFPVLQGTILIWSLFIIAMNFLVDVTYLFLDPRSARAH
jgi:peptide/nickel transport system permease protein